MKKLAYLLLILFCIASCKEEQKQKSVNPKYTDAIEQRISRIILNQNWVFHSD